MSGRPDAAAGLPAGMDADTFAGLVAGWREALRDETPERKAEILRAARPELRDALMPDLTGEEMAALLGVSLSQWRVIERVRREAHEDVIDAALDGLITWSAADKVRREHPAVQSFAVRAALRPKGARLRLPGVAGSGPEVKTCIAAVEWLENKCAQWLWQGRLGREELAAGGDEMLVAYADGWIAEHIDAPSPEGAILDSAGGEV